MRSRARARMTEAKGVSAAITDASAMRADQQGAKTSAAALVDLAEELGRLLARRLLDGQGSRRRGYSLPEILLGAIATAIVWILIAQSLSRLGR